MPETHTWVRPLTLALLGLCVSAPSAAQFDYSGDLSIRVDERSDRSFRSQYRFRFKPEYDFGNGWSAHGFVATGDKFDSAYNTIDDSDDDIYLRRLFARYERGDSKLEAGVIPPYKGRVSSTGLSKDGWIRGLRGVWGRPRGDLEIVVGDLEDSRASRALTGDFEVNYIEVEYAGQLNDSWTFQIGGEELIDDNFVRGEIRYLAKNQAYWALEIIHNTSASDSQVILSTRRDIARPRGPIEWFMFYSYTGSDFGSRAELSEDFVDIGHSVVTKFKGGVFSLERLKWFADVEFYEETARLKAGFEFSLD